MLWFVELRLGGSGPHRQPVLNLQPIYPKTESLSNRVLKKASCLFQNTKTKKCGFYFSHEINDLLVVDFARTSEMSDHVSW